ncbi:MAG: hypothetical protein ACRDNZ_02850 [Streptosporangiaceae bacterium]
MTESLTPVDIESSLPPPLLLGLSAERDTWQRRVLAAEIRGFDRGVASMAGERERGFVIGVLAVKRAQHDVHRSLQAELARWGGRREDFGRPREGDYQGGAVGWDGGAPDPAASRRIWLGGPAVHWHRCGEACYAIDPRHPYSPAEAAAILSTLPADGYIADTYPKEIARLLRARPSREEPAP